MKNRHGYIALFFSISMFLLAGCKQKAAEQDETVQGRIEQNHDKTEVKTKLSRYDRFEVELVSNGKVEAKTKAVLSFGVADLVDSVFVTNGSRVKKGAPLVQVDYHKSAEQLQEAELTLRKMELELRNRLMSEGITELKDSVNLPKARLHTIMLQSGYTSAVNSYKKALAEYEHIRVCAPFDGVVADLEAKPHNPSSLYPNVCTLIDDSQMEVVFNVLETEIAHIRRGMKVELTPYANHQVTLHGEVTEVNPKIDANGMVKIKAVTTNKDHVLVDGMNVNILLKRPVEHALIIPKSAVLPRQGKKVVFVHQNGKAIWKYVTTGMENSSDISIESGLREGEEVIYDNNLGLSHESEVVVVNAE